MFHKNTLFAIFALLLIFGFGWNAKANIDTGLVGYWTFDEGSGATAGDSAGANDGTLTNGPAWVAGKLGQALSFDGVDDYAKVQYDATLDLPNSGGFYFYVGISRR